MKKHIVIHLLSTLKLLYVNIKQYNIYFSLYIIQNKIYILIFIKYLNKINKLKFHYSENKKMLSKTINCRPTHPILNHLPVISLNVYQCLSFQLSIKYVSIFVHA